MAELFTATADLGPGASLSDVAGLVSDFETMCVGAQELALHEAAAAASTYIHNLLRRGGPRALRDEARRRELPAARFDDDLLEYIHDWPYEFGPRPPRRQAAWMLSVLGWSEFGPLHELFKQFQASYAAGQLSDDPLRVQSLQYENPFSAEIVVEGAALVTSLTVLLVVLRNWRPRRRRELAQAEAEVRVQRAAALDAEDQAWARMQLRRILLQQIAQGELHVSPETLNMVMSDNLAGAIDRLSQRELDIRRNPEAQP